MAKPILRISIVARKSERWRRTDRWACSTGPRDHVVVLEDSPALVNALAGEFARAGYRDT